MTPSLNASSRPVRIGPNIHPTVPATAYNDVVRKAVRILDYLAVAVWLLLSLRGLGVAVGGLFSWQLTHSRTAQEILWLILVCGLQILNVLVVGYGLVRQRHWALFLVPLMWVQFSSLREITFLGFVQLIMLLYMAARYLMITWDSILKAFRFMASLFPDHLAENQYAWVRKINTGAVTFDRVVGIIAGGFVLASTYIYLLPDTNSVSFPRAYLYDIAFHPRMAILSLYILSGIMRGRIWAFVLMLLRSFSLVMAYLQMKDVVIFRSTEPSAMSLTLQIGYLVYVLLLTYCVCRLAVLVPNRLRGLGSANMISPPA